MPIIVAVRAQVLALSLTCSVTFQHRVSAPCTALTFPSCVHLAHLDGGFAHRLPHVAVPLGMCTVLYMYSPPSLPGTVAGNTIEMENS